MKMTEKNDRNDSYGLTYIDPARGTTLDNDDFDHQLFLTDLVYAELMVQAIIANDINKPFFQAPLPSWMNARGDLRDRILKYVNMTHPSRTGHRWYLRKEWDDVLKDLIVKGEEKELVNRFAFGAFIAQVTLANLPAPVHVDPVDELDKDLKISNVIPLNYYKANETIHIGGVKLNVQEKEEKEKLETQTLSK